MQTAAIRRLTAGTWVAASAVDELLHGAVVDGYACGPMCGGYRD